MAKSNPGGTILVPIANPETADRLLDTAIDIADSWGASITAVHVVEVPAQIPLSEGDTLLTAEAESLLEYAADIGDEAPVPFETVTRYARDVGQGIVGGAGDHDAGTILMGWRGRPRRRDVILGSFVDRILRDAEQDVLVKRIRVPIPDQIDRILVPVDGSVHDAYATTVAGAIARRREATVTIAHVVAPDAAESVRAERRELLADRADLLEPCVSVETGLLDGAHVAGTITDETEAYDLITVGATRDGLFRRRLVGEIAEAVARHSSCPTIIARRFVEE